jgi:hypothetical protein
VTKHALQLLSLDPYLRGLLHCRPFLRLTLHLARLLKADISASGGVPAAPEALTQHSSSSSWKVQLFRPLCAIRSMGLLLGSTLSKFGGVGYENRGQRSRHQSVALNFQVCFMLSYSFNGIGLV